jgi:hypothetical protein
MEQLPWQRVKSKYEDARLRRESNSTEPLVLPTISSALRSFVSHHLDELDPSYWKKYLSTETPDQRRVLDLLALKSHWGGDDELNAFDFTLPGEITDYVLSVAFDESGAIAGMTMES